MRRAFHGRGRRRTLRNGLPRFVVFIIWDEEPGCCCASEGMVAQTTRKERKTKMKMREGERGRGGDGGIRSLHGGREGGLAERREDDTRRGNFSDTAHISLRFAHVLSPHSDTPNRGNHFIWSFLALAGSCNGNQVRLILF